jgi:hypothetical protein
MLHNYLLQANWTIYQKGAFYTGIKIFNNLPLEFKNVAGNLQKFKTALKQFLYSYSFYTLDKYFNQLWIMYCTTKFLIKLVLVLRFRLCTLYKHSLIVCYELISFPCINLVPYLCIVFIKLLLFVFYFEDSFCNVPIVILMTSSISTLVDLWNTEWMNIKNFKYFLKNFFL